MLRNKGEIWSGVKPGHPTINKLTEAAYMAKLIPCVLCDKVATHTIQPDGGTIVYYCTRHFNAAVKKLQQ